MKVLEQLGEAYVFTSNYHEDERGVFLKAFNTDAEAQQQYHIRQINYVATAEQGTLRGLHYQRAASAESKMFRIVKGAAQVAFADIRPNSETYLYSYTYILDDPKKAILIPRGYATGYLTLTADIVMLYTADNNYHPDAESGLLWNDPALNISWLASNPRLSEKDKAWALVKL